MLYGRHISISHGFTAAPKYAYDIGCTYFQIFLGSPKLILHKKRAKKDLLEFRKQLKKLDLRMVIHGSYTINLCNPENTKKKIDSVKSLIQDLNEASLIGNRCSGVIIHMGKNVGKKLSCDEAYQNYVDGLKEVINSTDSGTIILETGASQGTEIANDISGLARIYNSLDEEEQERIMFCIDTCHIWASGYDISTLKGVDNFFEEFNQEIGMDKIICIHLNDSRNKCNSHVDRHADLGYGEINIRGIKRVIKIAYQNNIPLIMETPLCMVDPETQHEASHEEQMMLISNLIKKWEK